MGLKQSIQLFERAKGIIPGGVNSPVRAFKAVGGSPPFIKRARGSKIYDVDGNSYIDYVGSWGPMILGHAHPKVTKALKNAISKGTSYGAPTPLEIKLVQLILEAFPSMEMVRFASSGTEATMSAIRLARAYTGRERIIKFEGCYHGHSDSLLVKAGSGATTFGVPDSPGVPADVARNTYTASYNDLASARVLFEGDPEGIACLIIEPVPGNMGVVLPEEGFLEGLRNLCGHYGSLLIFDEVMSGFRATYGGVQRMYNVEPDITCLGKIIGGGLPVGAFGGRKRIMEMLAPSGPVYQAGTLSGNPLAMTGGVETLKLLKREGVYERLETITKSIGNGLEEIAKKRGIPCQFQRSGSMFTLFFSERPIRNYHDAMGCDKERFTRYFSHMLKEGIYLPPSQFEAVFVSLAHTKMDVDKTLDAAKKALSGI